MASRAREFRERAALIRDHLGVSCWVHNFKSRGSRGGYYIFTKDPDRMNFAELSAETNRYAKPMKAADVDGALKAFERLDAYRIEELRVALVRRKEYIDRLEAKLAAERKALDRDHRAYVGLQNRRAS